MKISLVSGPAAEPLTVAELKLHLRIGIDDEDALLASFITAARTHIEIITQRSLVTQTWDYWLDRFPTQRRIELPRPPLQSVTGIYYIPDGASEATFAEDNYLVDAPFGAVCLGLNASWPGDLLQAVNGVRIRFVAGYGSAGADVPEPLRQAIRILAGDFYENRENAVVGQGVNVLSIPTGVLYLCQAYRIWRQV